MFLLSVLLFQREGLSKFNKIYEYEYHLFGQVSQIMKCAFTACILYFSSTLLVVLLISLYPLTSGCDSINDISIRTFTGSGVQSTIPEMVSRERSDRNCRAQGLHNTHKDLGFVQDHVWDCVIFYYDHSSHKIKILYTFTLLSYRIFIHTLTVICHCSPGTVVILYCYLKLRWRSIVLTT